MVVEKASLGESNEVVDTEFKEFLLSQPTTTYEVLVAVLDTGFATNGLYDNRIADSKMNFSSSGDSDSVLDDNGHGTKVSNLILSGTYDNVKVMPIKILNNEGQGTLLSMYLGIKHAIGQNVDIINISCSAIYADSELIDNVIAEAVAKGIIIVASAGNNNIDNSTSIPASNSNVFTIASINSKMQKSDFSNHGKVDFALLGEDVNVTGFDNQITKESGTSYSAAKFTAIVAHLLGNDDSLDKNAITEILKPHVLNSKLSAKYVGHGILSLEVLHEDELNEDIISEQNINDFPNWKELSDESFNSIIFEGNDLNNAIFLQRLTTEDLQTALNKSYTLRSEMVTEHADGSTTSQVYYKYLLGIDLSKVNKDWFDNTTGWDYLNINGQKVKMTVTLSTTDKSKSQTISWSYTWETANSYITGMSSHGATISSAWTHPTYGDSHYLPSYYETFSTKFTVNVPAGYYTSYVGNAGDISEQLFWYKHNRLGYLEQNRY